MFTTNQTNEAGCDMGRIVDQHQLEDAIFKSQRDIAVIQNEQKNIISRFDKQEATLEEVKKILAEAQGGWRALMLVGGFAAALGGIVSYFISHISFK